MIVSKFNTARDTLPVDYDLDKWLLETINPPKRLLDMVNRYRNTMNPEFKSVLPCITISANFKKYRESKNIHEKNPFLCIDIDRFAKKGKHNLCINMLLAKEMFMSHPCTYFCGYSVSGDDGLYAIIKLYDSDNLEKYFEHFKTKLANIGINIDSSCKDYTRLRFFSYDPEAYYNPKAKRYKLPIEKKITRPKTNFTPFKDDDKKVIDIIELIEHNNIDITSDYNDWVKIAGVLNYNFGEIGRDYFHRISRYNSNYKPSECDKKYTHCSKMNKVTNLGVLFNICTDYGIRY